MRRCCRSSTGFRQRKELRSTAYEKLLLPLVANIRVEVDAWRDANHAGLANADV